MFPVVYGGHTRRSLDKHHHRQMPGGDTRTSDIISTQQVCSAQQKQTAYILSVALDAHSVGHTNQLTALGKNIRPYYACLAVTPFAYRVHKDPPSVTRQMGILHAWWLWPGERWVHPASQYARSPGITTINSRSSAPLWRLCTVVYITFNIHYPTKQFTPMIASSKRSNVVGACSVTPLSSAFSYRRR